MFVACVAKYLEIPCSSNFVFTEKFSFGVGRAVDVCVCLQKCIGVEVTINNSVIACIFHSAVKGEETAFFDGFDEGWCTKNVIDLSVASIVGFGDGLFVVSAAMCVKQVIV